MDKHPWFYLTFEQQMTIKTNLLVALGKLDVVAMVVSPALAKELQKPHRLKTVRFCEYLEGLEVWINPRARNPQAVRFAARAGIMPWWQKIGGA